MENELIQVLPQSIFPDFSAMNNSDVSIFSRKKQLMELRQILRENLRPSAIMKSVSIEEFGVIFSENNQNEVENPLKQIFIRADYLELFVLTLGEKISQVISQFSQSRKMSSAAELDFMVSGCAEEFALQLQKRVHEKYCLSVEMAALRYSPGYCGWHISGQKALLSGLDSEKIGVSLNSGLIMTPEKSISGVIVCGKKEIHLFQPGFSCCKSCRHRSCIERMNSLR